MTSTRLLSIVDSPTHPNFSPLYRRLGIMEVRTAGMRKAIAQLKKSPPDYVVAEFFYGFGNNYAGVNISNLDVFLYSLQKYAPAARVIVLVGKADAPYVSKLTDLFKIHALLSLPATEQELSQLLVSC